MSEVWRAEMPSNIALIKYMGKKDVVKNIPANTSLSWTLPHLKTNVELEKTNQRADSWEPLTSDFPFEMSETGVEKFLGHLDRVKAYFNVNQNFIIRSSNNFPADCGIASSASSFAALTEAASAACTEISGQAISYEGKALLSAQGSGSSCRSFKEGMVLWSEKSVSSIESPFNNLLHMVVLVGKNKKEVSSSQAHKRVETSHLYSGRIERCEQRLEDLILSWSHRDWESSFQIIWNEFWDMHALFETSRPAFGYFEAGTLKVGCKK